MEGFVKKIDIPEDDHLVRKSEVLRSLSSVDVDHDYECDEYGGHRVDYYTCDFYEARAAIRFTDPAIALDRAELENILSKMTTNCNASEHMNVCPSDDDEAQYWFERGARACFDILQKAVDQKIKEHGEWMNKWCPREESRYEVGQQVIVTGDLIGGGQRQFEGTIAQIKDGKIQVVFDGKRRSEMWVDLADAGYRIKVVVDTNKGGPFDE